MSLYAQIKPDRIVNWLTARGWQKTNAKSSKYEVLSNAEHPDIELVVPKSREYFDYPKRTWELVRSLTYLFGLSETGIVSELLLPPGDTLQFTIEGAQASSGSIPLVSGMSLLQGAQAALLSVARSVVSPKSHHLGKPTEESRDFLGQCKMGQTERGSFVLNVFCPIIHIRPTKDMFAEPEQAIQMPFARNVTKKLLLSTHEIVSAVSRGEAASLSESKALQAGVSANLCDALLEMQPDDASSVLRLACSFSPEISDNVNDMKRLAEIGAVRIEQPHRAAILAVSTSLKPTVPQHVHVSVRGEVTLLKRSFGSEAKESSKEVQGEIEIHYLDGNDSARARLLLEPADYQRACDAHKSKKPVRVIGILDRSGKTPRFVEGALFEVIE